MIDCSTLALLTRRVPNYHLVSQSFLKGTFSVCNCAKCRHSDLAVVKNSTHLVCGRVLEHLRETGAQTGLAIVAENGTCDAAQFTSEDWSKFRLEAEVVRPEVVDVPDMKVEIMEPEAATEAVPEEVANA